MDRDEQDRWVRGLRARGCDARSIQEVLGIGRAQLRRAMQGLASRRRWTTQEVALICQLYPKGYTLMELAEASGHSASSVRRALLEAGMPRRSGPEAGLSRAEGRARRRAHVEQARAAFARCANTPLAELKTYAHRGGFELAMTGGGR